MTTQKNLNSCARQALPDSKFISAWLPSCLNDYENFLFLAFGKGRGKEEKQRKREKARKRWCGTEKVNIKLIMHLQKQVNCSRKEGTIKASEKKQDPESLLKSSTSAFV